MLILMWVLGIASMAAAGLSIMGSGGDLTISLDSIDSGTGQFFVVLVTSLEEPDKRWDEISHNLK